MKEDAPPRLEDPIPPDVLKEIRKLINFLDPAHKPPTIGHCIRTGMCCQNVLLQMSPRELRKTTEVYGRMKEIGLCPKKPECEDGGWSDKCGCGLDVDHHHCKSCKKIYADPRYEESPPIHEMLEGRCKGKSKVGFVYGPCRNLKMGVRDGQLVGECSIHETRPKMCRSYPNPERQRSENPGYMRGCGYNKDPNARHDEAEFEPGRLRPLTEQEK